MRLAAKLLVPVLGVVFLAGCSPGSNGPLSHSTSKKSTSREAGGTSTDNPMVALKVKFSGYDADAAARFCVGRVEFAASAGISSQQQRVNTATTQVPTYSNSGSSDSISKMIEQQMAMANAQIAAANAQIAAANKMIEQILSDLNLTLSADGTEVTSMTVESGHYQKVLVELTDSCGSGSSAQVLNGGGVYSTKESILLEFDGDAILDSSAQELVLDIQPHIERLQQVRSNNQIGGVLSSVQGSFAF